MDLHREGLAWRILDGQLLFLDVSNDRYFRLSDDENRRCLEKLGRYPEKQWHQPSSLARPADWTVPEQSSPAIRAWTDPGFRERLLADGSAACAEMGVPVEAMKLIVVENTADTHNVIVCTLCSCYPRNLLGLPPDWYKQREYRSRTVREPRKVLAEFGLNLPDSVKVQVHDSTADMRYLVLPKRPEGTEGWSAERLAEIVGRDSMIGVAVPQPH